MVFSSTIFLFFFLPLTLLAYFVVGPRGRNAILLAASLLFYAWGETVYLLVMLFSIAANYLFGRLIAEHDALKHNHNHILWALLNVAIWHDRFFR